MLRTAKPCGPGTRCWCQVRGGEVNSTGLISRQFAGDGGKRNSSPGRARYKPSTHCAGKAGMLPASPVVISPVHFCASLPHRGPWVPAGTRSSLRPLLNQRGKTTANLGRNSPRECAIMSVNRQSVSLFDSSLRAKRSNPESFRGDNLDCFVAYAPRNDGSDALPDSIFKQRIRLCILAACSARGLLEVLTLSRTEGAGKTGCRLAPMAPCAAGLRKNAQGK